MKPWDYADKCYKCLCDDCHAQREIIEKTIEKSLAFFSTNQLDDMLFRVFVPAEKHSTQKIGDWIASAERNEEGESL